MGFYSNDNLQREGVSPSTAEYLLGMPLVGDFLEEGLSMIILDRLRYRDAYPSRLVTTRLIIRSTNRGRNRQQMRSLNDSKNSASSLRAKSGVCSLGLSAGCRGHPRKGRGPEPVSCRGRNLSFFAGRVDLADLRCLTTHAAKPMGAHRTPLALCVWTTFLPRWVGGVVRKVS
jgi:hypothetical protein